MSERRDTAIRRVSPTSAEDLLKCRARALRSGPGGTFVETPTLALGNAAHAVSEMVYNGEFDTLDPENVLPRLVEAFDKEIEQRRTKMIENAGGREVPVPRRWRNYRTIRSRLPRFLASEVELRQDGNAPELLAVEDEFTSQDGVIYGCPDRIERDGDVVRVVDLKSGLTHPEGIPDQYRRQLMLYAYLWHEKTGDWPDEAAVQRVDGRLESIDVEPDQILALVDTIRTRRDEANQLLQSGEGDDALAEPSPDACKWCRRRPYCKPFAESIDESYALGGPCIFGTVTDVIEGDGTDGVDIAITASNLAPNTTAIRVIGVSKQDNLRTGDTVAVVDARSTSKPELISLNAWSALTLLN